jgi:hypothetical protein
MAAHRRSDRRRVCLCAGVLRRCGALIAWASGIQSFCHCRVESERGRICRVKHWKGTLAIVTALSASITLADDFKTINGKEYKNATVIRVEPDGIVIEYKSGISRIRFIELPKEVQERFGYDAAKVAEQAAEVQKRQENAERERHDKEEKAEADLKHVVEQFQAAEQRSKQTYQSATKGTLSGQVFVSTIGGKNLKLGAVQVALFPRDAIDILIAGLKTYADIKIQQLRPSVDAARAAYQQAEVAERAAFGAHLKSIRNRDSGRAWKEAQEAYYAARDQYFEASRGLNYYYSGDFYFGYLQSALQTTATDAEGKFVIEVPQTGAFVIATQARREFLETTERYYWLQPVPFDGQQQRVQNLSNNNLTSTTGASSLIHTQDSERYSAANEVLGIDR